MRFSLPHEVVVHGAGGQQRAERHAVGADRAVGEHDERLAVVDGRFGLGADAVERLDHAGLAFVARPGDVDLARVPAAAVHALERGDLLVRQNRVRHAQPAGVLLGRFEQVLLGADVALQRHDHFLADRVDRGVGDLGEELPEVVVQHPRLVAEAGQARVVAHRADGVLLRLDHRQQHEVHRLDRVAEGLHALQQRAALEAVRAGLGVQVVEVDALLLEPLGVGAPAGEVVLQLLVGNQPALFEVDQEHAARLQAALGLHVLRLDRAEHADFAGHDHAVVVREVVARGPQAVAIEHGADVLAVGKRDRRRAVPRLHQATVVFVERPLVLGHGLVVLPRLGDHHHDGLLQRAAGHEQELQHVVERAGVAAVGLDDGEQLLELVAEQLAA